MMRLFFALCLLLAEARADWFDLSLQGGPQAVWMEPDGSAFFQSAAYPDSYSEGDIWNHYEVGDDGGWYYYRQAHRYSGGSWSAVVGDSTYLSISGLSDLAHYSAGGSSDVPPSWMSSTSGYGASSNDVPLTFVAAVETARTAITWGLSIMAFGVGFVCGAGLAIWGMIKAYRRLRAAGVSLRA